MFLSNCNWFRWMVIEFRGIVNKFRSMVIKLRSLVIKFRWMVIKFRSMVIEIRNKLVKTITPILWHLVKVLGKIQSPLNTISHSSLYSVKFRMGWWAFLFFVWIILIVNLATFIVKTSKLFWFDYKILVLFFTLFFQHSALQTKPTLMKLTMDF